MTRRRQLSPAFMAGVFWGSILGLYEATVGFLIHSLPRVPGTASVLLVPFALYCLYGAARSAGARGVVTATATAVAIKLIDFVLPALTPLAVINPAVALLFEGLSFLVIARVLRWPARRAALPALVVGALAFNVAWRALFLAYSAILARSGAGGILAGGNRVDFTFLFRDAGLSSAVILLLLIVARPATGSAPATRFSPRLSLGMLALAVAAKLASDLVWRP